MRLTRILFWILLVATAAAARPCAAKPSREQIEALAQECKTQKKRMDLVATFGTDFSDLDLSGVDFRGAHAIRLETNLRGADLSRSNLRGAQFGASILDGANLSDADLEDATFVTASLRGVNLLRAKLRRTQFYQSDLSGAKLARADLSASDVTGSEFAGADLSDAIIAGAKNDYWWNDFRKANLARAKLAGLKLNGARFGEADLRSADFSGAELIQADFTGANLEGASLKDANVESAVFTDVRGVRDDERKGLESRARRWKFELKSGATSFLRAAYFPAYLLLLLTLIGLSIYLLRVSARPRSLTVAAVINALTFAPVCLAFLLLASGTSPTAQFNAGRPGAMAGWSAWVSLWPPFMLLLLGCLVASVVTALIFIFLSWRRGASGRQKPALLYVVLTVLHCLFGLHWMASNHPSA